MNSLFQKPILIVSVPSLFMTVNRLSQLKSVVEQCKQGTSNLPFPTNITPNRLDSWPAGRGITRLRAHLPIMSNEPCAIRSLASPRSAKLALLAAVCREALPGGCSFHVHGPQRRRSRRGASQAPLAAWCLGEGLARRRRSWMVKRMEVGRSQGIRVPSSQGDPDVH